jgi:hypothetical protein
MLWSDPFASFPFAPLPRGSAFLPPVDVTVSGGDLVPRGVDPDSIAASMENGVLSLIVPKPERLQPKRIAIGEQQRELEAAAA